jgi:hypothetical protein
VLLPLFATSVLMVHSIVCSVKYLYLWLSSVMIYIKSVWKQNAKENTRSYEMRNKWGMKERV